MFHGLFSEKKRSKSGGVSLTWSWGQLLPQRKTLTTRLQYSFWSLFVFSTMQPWAVAVAVILNIAIYISLCTCQSARCTELSARRRENSIRIFTESAWVWKLVGTEASDAFTALSIIESLRRGIVQIMAKARKKTQKKTPVSASKTCMIAQWLCHTKRFEWVVVAHSLEYESNDKLKHAYNGTRVNPCKSVYVIWNSY